MAAEPVGSGESRPWGLKPIPAGFRLVGPDVGEPRAAGEFCPTWPGRAVPGAPDPAMWKIAVLPSVVILVCTMSKGALTAWAAAEAMPPVWVS